MGTMTLLALTYTRDAATGPMLMGGRAEVARQGGGSGMILPPPVCKFNRKTILLRCRRKAASRCVACCGEAWLHSRQRLSCAYNRL